MNDKNGNGEIINIDERGRARDGSPLFLNKRLFMQFLAFGCCDNVKVLIEDLKNQSFEAVLYTDINDFRGVGLLTMGDDANFFVSELRDFLQESSFLRLRNKTEYTMLGRTYSFGYENDLEKTLITDPKRKIMDKDFSWAIWYPLQRAKEFEALPPDKQRVILGEHGKIGFKFGKAGYAKDIRLACHGLDKNDNDFVIGVLGRELYPLSAVIQTMRKTEQTFKYIEKLGPFFVGRKIWQSKI